MLLFIPIFFFFLRISRIIFQKRFVVLFVIDSGVVVILVIVIHVYNQHQYYILLQQQNDNIQQFWNHLLYLFVLFRIFLFVFWKHWPVWRKTFLFLFLKIFWTTSQNNNKKCHKQHTTLFVSCVCICFSKVYKIICTLFHNQII